LVQVSAGARLDVGDAVAALADQPPGILLVIAFALVLTTMITQSFAFEFIRVLEGYWGAGWLSTSVASARIRAHAKRKRRLDMLRQRAERAAFNAARERMFDEGVERVLVHVLELDFLGASENDLLVYPELKREEALSMGWQASAPPWTMRRVDAAAQRLDAYPEDHRLLPTKLGNTLRANEDSLRIADSGDLQGYVMRNYDRISPVLLERHSQSRTRLDMYCSLAFVFGVLAAASVVALWKFPPFHLPAYLASSALVGLGYLSYVGAVSSARGYGSVLRAIDAQITSIVNGAVPRRAEPAPSSVTGAADI
jgi:hypothetical protein